MNKIYPRCPRCGSVELQGQIIGLATIVEHYFGIVNLVEGELPPKDITAVTEAYNYFTSNPEAIESLMHEIDEEYQDEDDPAPYSKALSTVDCLECKYTMYLAELGLESWIALVPVANGSSLWKEDVVGTVQAASYNKRKKLYTATDISELAEALADPELYEIAKRKEDELNQIRG